MEVLVTANIGKEKYHTEVVAGEHIIFTDEPVSLGGGDKAMNPFELLAASLATCTAATLRMYIDRKKWNADKIEVQVKMNYNKGEQFTNFDRVISFPGSGLSGEQADELYSIANRCPVHKVLEGQVGITTLVK